MKFVLRFGLCLALLPAASWAQEQDAEGCKDSAVITRMAGSKINSCDNKEFDQFTFPLAPDAAGNEQSKVAEGEMHTWDYGTREGVSEIQVFRNIETALKRAGFAIDYELSPSQITAHKGKTWYMLDNRGSYYDQTIVTEKAMEQEITASDLNDEINKSGHVAVYGIHFDTGKATIQPDSEAVLQQIVQLLQQNPTLSEKRAQAVVAWLTAHGVNSSRLVAKGFGASKPVSANNTEEGRAKNRRVELAKM